MSVIQQTVSISEEKNKKRYEEKNKKRITRRNIQKTIKG
jgi:hypothetical protein